MAVAVESYTSASSTATSVTVTKPTGVAVGDLLLIFAATGPTQNYACSGFSATYTELYNGPGGISDAGLRVLYKIADSGDVAASNYSVTGGSNSEGTVVAMVRVSGWDGLPVFYQDSEGGFFNSTNGTFTKSGISLTRLTQQIQFVVLTSYDSDNSDYYGDATNITLTSSDSNPSWTEICNIKAVTNASTGVSAKSMTLAYATTSLSSPVTAFSFDYSEYDADSTAAGFGALLLIEVPQNGSGTNTLLEVGPILFSESAVEVGTTGTSTLLSVSPTFQNHSGTAGTPTIWTKTPKS